MISLKAFLPVVAPIVGSTTDALYSRQRKLVQMGVLPITPGRGPGSGTPLTTETIGIFLVALLYADGVADLDAGISEVLNAVPSYLTKKSKFIKKNENFLQTLDHYIEAMISAGGDIDLERISVSRRTAEMFLLVREDNNLRTEVLTFNVGRGQERPASLITKTSSFDLYPLCKMLGGLVPGPPVEKP